MGNWGLYVCTESTPVPGRFLAGYVVTYLIVHVSDGHECLWPLMRLVFVFFNFVSYVSGIKSTLSHSFSENEISMKKQESCGAQKNGSQLRWVPPKVQLIHTVPSYCY